MQRRNLSFANGRWQLDDFPGAARVVVLQRLERADVQYVADLSLHRNDLEQVQLWGQALARLGPDVDADFTIRRGLLYSMIVLFCKCFGGNRGRFSLDPKAVYQGNDKLLQDYRYFDHLRDRSLVHDENTMSQSFPVAVLNHPGQEPKVEEVVCTSIHLVPFSKPTIDKLYGLVVAAERWVEVAFDEAHTRLKAELEKLAYDQLDALPSTLDYEPPEEWDASTPKPRHRREKKKR